VPETVNPAVTEYSTYGRKTKSALNVTLLTFTLYDLTQLVAKRTDDNHSLRPFGVGVAVQLLATIDTPVELLFSMVITYGADVVRGVLKTAVRFNTLNNPPPKDESTETVTVRKGEPVGMESIPAL
jgi:hypothetical protein